MANFYKIKYSGKQLEELLDQIYDIPYSSGDGIILAETQIQANVTTMLYSDGLYYWYINGDKTNIVNPDGEGATAPTATIGENGFWYLNGQQTNLLVPSGKSISLDPNYAKFTNYLTTEKVNEQLEPILTDIANLKVTKQDSLIAGNCITIQNNTISTTVDIPTQISDLPNDANYVNLNEVKNYVDPIDETLRSDIASHGTRLSTLENAIQNKVDKVDGKGLSTNDFTTEYKTQLDDLSTTYATKQDLTDIINGAPEEYDTLKEIAEWIKSDESGSAAMTSDIATLKSYFTNGSANKALADQSGNNIETTYAKISDFNSLSAEVETKQDTLVSGTNIKTVNGNSLIGSGNIELSDDTVVIDLGTLAEESGTLSPTLVSEINNAISENKNIVLKVNPGFDMFIPNVMYAAGQELYGFSFLPGSNFSVGSLFITIMLPSGQYILHSFGLQSELVSGTNIKTVNNQSILGEGNIEISPSKFQIIDLSTGETYGAIENIYIKIINEFDLTDNNTFTFSNQASIYNNIATAINNGLVPILKFVDGYGYYKEYLSSSSEYVFTLNHISTPELATNPANNVITLKIGNTTNKCYYSNLSQIPTTVVISSGAFGDSGSLTSTESRNLRELLTTAQYNLSAGIFILNNIDKKIYYVTESKSEKFTTLMAYTMNLNSVEVLNLTLSGSVFNYTKTTYALGGGGESNTVVIDLGTLSSTGGTLSSEILTQINNNLGSKSIIFEGNISGISITTATYFVAANMIIISALDSNTVHNLTIKLTDGRYETNQVLLLDSADTKTINNTSLYGAGNIAVQEPLVSGTNIKTVNGQTLLGNGNIEISSSTKMVNLGTLPNIGNIPSDKLQELMTLAQNGDLIQATFVFDNSQFITASAYSNGSSIGIVAYDVSNSLNVVNLSINIANTSYTITTISLPTSFKTINDAEITGSGNISVQEPLISGTNIKTVNGQSLLGSGDLPITADITYATDEEVNALFTNPGQPIPERTISLENLNAFKQQIDNEIGKVLEEGF